MTLDDEIQQALINIGMKPTEAAEIVNYEKTKKTHQLRRIARYFPHFNNFIVERISDQQDKKPRLDEKIVLPSEGIPFEVFTVCNLGKNASIHLVDIEETILQSMRIIRRECKMAGCSSYRVPPLIISRLARGGKTTALMALFDALKSSAEFLPIIVSFNSSANFDLVDDENNEETILRAIATQFYNNLPFKPNEIVFDKAKVLAFLDEAGKSFSGGVVLLIDELNALSRPLDRAGARFLQKEFLDHPNRYLVFTSHVLMTLESNYKNLDELLGTVSSRTYRTVHMPQCFDLNELRKMPRCAALTKSFVSLCSGIPSLIYSVISLREETLTDRFNRLGLTISALEHRTVLSDFVGEVLYGVRSASASCRRFDGLSTIVGVEKIQWPLFYIGCICKLFTKFDSSVFIGRLICHDLLIYSQTEEGGKDWEVIITVATILRSLYSNLYGTLGPFNLCPINIYPNVKCISTDLLTLDEVLEVVTNFYSTTNTSTILTVSLEYNKFADFDLLVCFGKLNSYICDGYQMKLNRTYPKRDIPVGIRQGLVFHSKEPAHDKLKSGWRYLSEDEIVQFLGFSLAQLISSCHGDVPDADDFE
mmetsp:Transcript_33825/g.49111  ORF Transcript_33825/g.49111 Transcript_33825/m.49111 type:complete len:592 (+) Transcript_33825:3-1778(+)